MTNANTTDDRQPSVAGGFRAVPAMVLLLCSLLGLFIPGAAVAQLEQPEVVKLETHWSSSPARPGGQLALGVVLQIDHPYHVNPDKQRLPREFDYLIPTTLTVTSASDLVRFGPVQYPQPHDVQVNYTGQSQTIKALEGRVVLYVPVFLDAAVAPGDVAFKVSLEYQACDDKSCLMPATIEREVTLQVAGPDVPVVEVNDTGLFADFDSQSFATINGGAVAFDLFGWSFDHDASSVGGFALLLLIAAAGGMLLNLTPCVLPVVPIKVISLSRAAANRARCLLLGLMMSLGIVAFWLALGAVMASVAGFTQTNKLFQYPSFTILVGVVIAIMAAGMSGTFTVRLPRMIYMFDPKHDSLPGSFAMGIMTAVLSTPCTAPLMGAAAAWAITQSAVTSLATFAAIGAGMAMPYLVLSAFPALVEKVPRTGPGSELLKQVMSLLLLAAGAYFVGVGVSTLMVEAPDSPSNAYWWGVAFFVGAAGAWLAIRTLQITRSAPRRVIFSGLGAAVVVLAAVGGQRLTSPGPIDWINYTPQRLEQALNAGQVVVMDFTAEWCLNCKVLEHAVLYDDRVVRLFADRTVVPMKVDITGENEPGKAKLHEAGRVTIPLLVVYAPDGREVFKSDAYTVAQVVQAVETARGRRVSLRDDH